MHSIKLTVCLRDVNYCARKQYRLRATSRTLGVYCILRMILYTLESSTRTYQLEQHYVWTFCILLQWSMHSYYQSTTITSSYSSQCAWCAYYSSTTTRRVVHVQYAICIVNCIHTLVGQECACYQSRYAPITCVQYYYCTTRTILILSQQYPYQSTRTCTLASMQN